MTVDDQIIDLQTRLAFQEDALAQLNDIIATQDADIVQLKQQLRLLAQRLNDMQHQGVEEGVLMEDERPPHY